MSLSTKSSLTQMPYSKLGLLMAHDYTLLWTRFSLVLFNYLMLFYGGQPFLQFKTAFEFYLPLFLLCYALITLFGIYFFNFRAVNYCLSILDIFLISLGLFFLPGKIFWGAFMLYFLGLSLEIMYGSIYSTLVMAVCANIGYVLAIQPQIASLTFSSYVYWFVNFNFIILLIFGFGTHVKKTVLLAKKEKAESKKQFLRLQAVSRIAREIAGELEHDKLTALIIQKATELTKAPVGGLILKDSEQIYRVKAIKGLSKSLLELEINPGSGLLGRGLTAKNSLLEHNLHHIAASGQHPDLEHFHFALAAPIWTKNEVMGSLFLLSDSPVNPFSQDDRFLLETLSEHASIAMINANLFKMSSSLSMNDYLTGVGNLRFFHQQLEHCIAIAERYKQPCSLMLVDSDSFKQINDQFGNARGFLYIKQLAQVLKNLTRSSDLIARYDRDLFMLILPQTDLTEAVRLGERIRENVAQTPLILDGKAIQTTVCIGVASYPEDVSNAKSLLSAVETALHRAKHLGNNQLVTGQAANYYYQM